MSEEEGRIDRRAAAFRSAVDDEAERRTAEIRAEFDALKAFIEERLVAAEQPEPTPAPPNAEVVAFLKPVFESLGMTMADIATQGTGAQRPISPEVIRTREEAHQQMLALIRHAKENGLKPKYRVKAIIVPDFPNRQGVNPVTPFWTDKDKIEQPTDITFPGIPNLALEPINDIAQAIHAAFRESIGNLARPGGGEDYGDIVVHGATGPEIKRHAPKAFDVDPGDGVHVLHRGNRGQERRVHILGTVAEPATIAN